MKLALAIETHDPGRERGLGTWSRPGQDPSNVHGPVLLLHSWNRDGTKRVAQSHSLAASRQARATASSTQIARRNMRSGDMHRAETSSRDKIFVRDLEYTRAPLCRTVCYGIVPWTHHVLTCPITKHSHFWNGTQQIRSSAHSRFAIAVTQTPLRGEGLWNRLTRQT